MLDGPSQSQGWTNYTQCFLPEIRDMMKKLDSGSPQEAEVRVTRPTCFVNDVGKLL